MKFKTIIANGEMNLNLYNWITRYWHHVFWYLPSLAVAKEYYQIGFEEFAIVMFHPVTTEERDMKVYVGNLIESLLNDTQFMLSFIQIMIGSQYIIDA
jgi:hypothetical protein